ncbi:CNNM domain-containing protein [Clostridium akagii]|uniref:CNNM domain-containing protein n=1 Tax=Clostridium akagii TaxID=91623 RepID=UPI00056B625D|nr:CNNM domain-containing protein [Clostridium akagii]
MSKKNNNRKSNVKSRRKWILTITFWSIFISGGFSFLSDLLLKNVNLLVAFVILALIITLGVVFDIIGVAVTAANETPFHAMASKKIKGAKIAINLIRNADKVSSFCNDVIGDICGIISGSVGMFISQKILIAFNNTNATFISVAIGALVASATICGKSTGKSFAMQNSNEIVAKVSRGLYLIVKDR